MGWFLLHRDPFGGGFRDPFGGGFRDPFGGGFRDPFGGGFRDPFAGRISVPRRVLAIPSGFVVVWTA